MVQGVPPTSRPPRSALGDLTNVLASPPPSAPSTAATAAAITAADEAWAECRLLTIDERIELYPHYEGLQRAALPAQGLCSAPFVASVGPEERRPPLLEAAAWQSGAVGDHDSHSV